MIILTAYHYFIFVAQSSFIYGGAFYFEGGSQSLSNALRDEFLRLGGQLKLNTQVLSIIFNNDRISGCKTSKNIDLNCDFIIANCAIPYLIDNLLPEQFTSKLLRKVKRHAPACSISNLYLGFNSNLKNLGSNYYSNFIIAENTIEYFKEFRKFSQHKLRNSKLLNWSNLASCLVDYSQVNHKLCNKEYSSAVMCTIDYASRWKNLDKSHT